MESNIQRVRIYRDVIVRNLIPSQVLPHLYMVDGVEGEASKIKGTEKNGTKEEAAEILVDVLLRSNEEGWFYIFLAALKHKGFEKLSRLLQGYQDVRDHTLLEKLLQLYYVPICDRVDPRDLLSHLIQSGTITKEDKDLIEADVKSAGPSSAVLTLLDLVVRKKESWFQDLMKALVETGYDYIVEQIDPKLPNAVRSGDDTSLQKICNSLSAQSGCESVATHKKCMDEDMDTECAVGGASAAVGYSVMESQLQYSSQPGEQNASLYAPNTSHTGENSAQHAQTLPRPAPEGADDNTQPSGRRLHMEESSASSISQEDTSISQASVDVPEMDTVEQEALKLRPYQLELAADALEGKNSIILAPTGSGKTHVALYISQNHARECDIGVEAKIVFLVPTAALVTQQLKQYQTYLSELPSVGLRGDTDESLSLRLPMYSVFVLTPQILLNALQSGEVPSLDQFTLLIFDECHHTNKNHPYNIIMRCYFQERQQGNTNLPQVVGLTASVGVGKTNRVDRAVDHILKICANLDGRLKTVQTEKTSLESFVNPPDEDTREVRGRKHDPFSEMISGFMTQIEEHLRKLPDQYTDKHVALLKDKLNAPSEKGSDQYTGWVSGLQKPVAKIYDQNARRVFVACRKHLRVYNDALLVNSDCRTVDAWNYITKELSETSDTSYKDETDKWLENIFFDAQVQRRLEEITNDKKFVNPKLESVKEILLEKYRENPDLRAILFCKTREMTEALKCWMHADEDLMPLNADKVVGAHSSVDRGGMTSSAQDDVIKYFKDGKHKVLIATSVAEEGLDIAKCSLVIRYQHVTNETARIQAKGRGRDEDSQYIVVAESDRGMKKEEINQAREKLMHKAITAVLEIPKEEVDRRIQEIQKQEQLKAKQEEVAKIAMEAFRQQSVCHDEDIELRCLKCDELACLTSEVKHVDKTLHMVVSSDFDENITIEPHPKPIHIKGGAEKVGKIFCKRCHYDWGITGIYQGITYPIIKINSFVIIFPNGNRDTCKKWVNVPFKIEPLTVEDREAMIEKLKANN